MTKEEQIEKLTVAVQRVLTKNISKNTPSWTYDLGATEIAKALVEEENVVVLPCKVGDKFWWLSRLYDGSFVVKSEEVQVIEITEQGVFIIDMDGAEWCYFSDIYFTKEAAEKALEELKK
nr:MAG TPA: hypothetical protein [Caudoviricetes sp.]